MEFNDVKNPFVSELSESLVDELVGAVGLPKTHLNHQIAWGLFHDITERLAKIGVPFDQLVREKGLPAASTWILKFFCNPAQANIQNDIPQEGPLLVASNHPGAYDAMVLFSQLNRTDIRWISSEIPFLRLLPHTSGHIFFAPRDESASRMIVMRKAIRHLQAGGTLVYLASGHRDPDPAVYPGAEKAIDNWLPVFNSFYKYVPGLKILPTIASGMVSEGWAHHPITRLRRKQIDKHRLAEFGQVITQLLHPGRLMITPSVSFGTAVSQEDLQREGVESDFQAEIIARGKALLQTHVEKYGCTYL